MEMENTDPKTPLKLDSTDSTSQVTVVRQTCMTG